MTRHFKARHDQKFSTTQKKGGTQPQPQWDNIRKFARPPTISAGYLKAAIYHYIIVYGTGRTKTISNRMHLLWHRPICKCNIYSKHTGVPHSVPETLAAMVAQRSSPMICGTSLPFWKSAELRMLHAICHYVQSIDVCSITCRLIWQISRQTTILQSKERMNMEKRNQRHKGTKRLNRLLNRPLLLGTELINEGDIPMEQSV